MPEEAGDQWQQEGEQEEQRDEMTQRKRIHLLGVVDGQDVPFAVAVVVTEELVEGLAGIVGAVGVGDKIDVPASPDDALVELDVLVAGQSGVVHAILVKDLPFPAAKGDGVHLLDLLDAGAEQGIANPEPVAEHLPDGQCLGGLVQYISLADGPHIVGPQLMKPAYQGGEIVGRVAGMGIQPHDDLSTGLRDASVHCPRRCVFGVVQQAEVRITRHVVADDLPGAVAAHAVHQQDLQVIFGIVLRHDGLDAGCNVFFFVVYRTNNGKHDE